MNKPSLLFFCHAYTELQIWVVCKILLKGKHGCFRAPVLQHLSLKSKHTQIHTSQLPETYGNSDPKSHEIHSFFLQLLYNFSFHRHSVSQSHWSICWITPSVSSHIDSHENPYLYWLFVERSAFTLPANSIKE